MIRRAHFVWPATIVVFGAAAVAAGLIAKPPPAPSGADSVIIARVTTAVVDDATLATIPDRSEGPSAVSVPTTTATSLSTPISTPATPPSAAPMSATQPTPPPAPTTTTVPLVDRTALTVVVGGGDEQDALVAAVLDELSGLAYSASFVAVGDSERSVVYYVPGRRREARRLAEEIGLTIDDLASAADGPSVDNVDDFDILVVVGPSAT